LSNPKELKKEKIMQKGLELFQNLGFILRYLTSSKHLGWVWEVSITISDLKIF